MLATQSSLHDDINRNLNPGMHRAKQEIFSVDVIHIDYVGVGPAHWPRLSDHEPIAAILKTRSSCDDDGLANGEGVLPAKIRPKPVIGDMSALLGFTPLSLRFVLFILTGGLCFLFGVLVLISVFVGLSVFFFFFVLVYAFVVLLPCGRSGFASGSARFSSCGCDSSCCA